MLPGERSGSAAVLAQRVVEDHGEMLGAHRQIRTRRASYDSA
jgi:hypothetical protein